MEGTELRARVPLGRLKNLVQDVIKGLRLKSGIEREGTDTRHRMNKAVIQRGIKQPLVSVLPHSRRCGGVLY